jgi:mannose/cellobiose epimerase-like protein (N-acyl-D-glucosamine 2-epimerase family)
MATWMPYVEDAMRRVVKHFDTERKCFMETVDPVTGVDHSSMGGRFFNPGHSIEVAW